MYQVEIENIRNQWNYLDISIQKELVKKYLEDEGHKEGKNWMEFLADKLMLEEYAIKY